MRLWILLVGAVLERQGAAKVFWRSECPKAHLGRLLLPDSPSLITCCGTSVQDFTSSQCGSGESSMSDRPTSMAMTREMSESLLAAGSCSLLAV